MTAPTKQFPDAERVLLNLLEQVAPTVTATGDSFTPPLIRVNRTGGGVDRLGLTDRARLEIACYGTTREASREMNERVRVLVLACGASTVNGVYIDRAVEDTAPTQIPYEAPDIRRVVSTYTLSFRRQ